ncbi:hypothetical protein JAAARDRAFT_38454 [Jaapia argillacea MUCL 33604]|uniref:Uncharacterized protein n=1 Tax=Jaapia argillacea MUCL 33604 TaxID=933084 RepID=A0A067PVD9_9AGAM|nr:hypothetical protein JAAARDRAFT_38454 [Jaapia argillacea MUCL 33604]
MGFFSFGTTQTNTPQTPSKSIISSPMPLIPSGHRHHSSPPTRRRADSSPQSVRHKAPTEQAYHRPREEHRRRSDDGWRSQETSSSSPGKRPILKRPRRAGNADPRHATHCRKVSFEVSAKSISMSQPSTQQPFPDTRFHVGG